MRFGVLGSLAVWAPDGTLVPVPEAKVRALLADLLIQRGSAISTDRLIEDLWGGAAPAQAANALQAKVSGLRRALRPVLPPGRDVVTLGPGGYTLHVEPGDVDAEVFSALLARARASGDPRHRVDLISEALRLWRGVPLAEVRDEPFARTAATRWEEERLAALEERADAYVELGEPGAVVAELEELVDHHPLRERLRASYLRALYATGRQSDALASYHDLRTRLADELGVDPSPALAELYAAILQQDPDLVRPRAQRSPEARSESGASSQRERSPTNLPAPVTELIGRADAQASVRALLEANRLVTLTGPGGVGKTALALAVGRQLGDGELSPPDGVWLVELGALPTAGDDGDVAGRLAGVVETVAAVLGVRDDVVAGPSAAAAVRANRERDLLDRLGAALRDRTLVLVIDNCEHVVEPVARVLERLLGAAPGLRVLATSREPLELPGEVTWMVPPLELPTPVASDPDAVAAFSATALFLARARAAAPGFVLTPDIAAAVAAIVRRLDGIPLALELAASRVRALDARELAERLDDRFRLLAAGKRGVPARQRTLRAVIDWSWQLLDEDERAVLRRLSVHADGCTLATAETVCAGGGVGESDVAAILSRLVDRSLVVPTGETGTRRYGLLESVAAYGLEQLVAAGEADWARERHRRHFADLAERAADHLRGAGQRDWLRRLDADLANLHRALDSAVHDADASTALRLVNALVWYCFLRGRWHEALRFLERAIAVPGPSPAHLVARARTWHAGLTMVTVPGRLDSNAEVLKHYDGLDDPAGFAFACWLLGFGEFLFGDLRTSERLIDDAVQAFTGLGDRWGLAAALNVRASQAIFHGDLAAVDRDAARSYELFSELGDGWGRLRAIDGLGIHAEITGDYARAAELYQDGSRIAEDLDLGADIATMLSRQGRIAILTGDYTRADELLNRAHRLAKEASNAAGEEFASIGLAISARHQGRLDDAESHLRRWLDWNRTVEADYGVALILAQLGFIAEQRGDVEGARERHRDGLTAARATGDPRAVALAYEGLAGAEALANQHRQAAWLLGAAASIRESVGAALPPGERFDVDRSSAAAIAALGADTFNAEYASGHRAAGGADPRDHVDFVTPRVTKST